MNLIVFFMIPARILFTALIGLGIYVTILIVKALRKYTKSEPVRKEKKENARSLGEVLKQHMGYRSHQLAALNDGTSRYE